MPRDDLRRVRLFHEELAGPDQEIVAQYPRHGVQDRRVRGDFPGQRHDDVTGGASVLVQWAGQPIVQPLRFNLFQLRPPLGGLIGADRLNGKEEPVILILLFQAGAEIAL